MNTLIKVAFRLTARVAELEGALRQRESDTGLLITFIEALETACSESLDLEDDLIFKAVRREHKARAALSAANETKET